MLGLKRTSLYNVHVELGAKMVEFAGWEMPLQYYGILKEHEGVRTTAGLFDVSHMGEIEIKGKDATDFINFIMTNDIRLIKSQQVQYTLMCYSTGGIVDDLLVYKYSDRHYLLVVNASNTIKDYNWLISNKKGEVEITDISAYYSQIALQGPKALEILSKLTKEDLNGIPFFHFNEDVKILGEKCLVSRTGYTGEDGFEIYMDNTLAPKIWKGILKAGEEFSITPAGLGSRDLLRFEAALPLYGHEINQDITPLEANLKPFIKLDKENFIGKEALIKQETEGVKRKIAGFEMIGKGVPRQGYGIYKDGEKIGYVTTGAFSPSLKKNIGLALIDSRFAEPGNNFEVNIRNKGVEGTTVKIPFYKKKYKGNLQK